MLDLSRSVLSDSCLPAHYWDRAISMAVHILDFVLSSYHPGKILFEIQTGQKLDVSYLHPFRYMAYAKVLREEEGSKLDA